MIKEFKKKASAQNFYVWVIKQTTGVSRKNRGPKTATRQNIGAASPAPAAPLPTPLKLYLDNERTKEHMSITQIQLF